MKKTPLDIIREAQIKALEPQVDRSSEDLLAQRVSNTRHPLLNLGSLSPDLTVWGVDGRGMENITDTTRFVIKNLEEPVGLLTIRPFPSLPNAASVVISYVIPRFRYRGAGEAIYRFVINRGITLVSDHQISPSALRVWEKLARDPSIRVGVLREDFSIDYSDDPMISIMRDEHTQLVASLKHINEDSEDGKRFYRELQPHTTAYGEQEFEPKIESWPPSPHEWRELERAVLQSPEWLGYWARFGWTSWTTLSGHWWYDKHKNQFSFYDVPEISYFHNKAKPDRTLVRLDSQGNEISNDSPYSHLHAVLPSALRLCRDKVKDAVSKMRFLKGTYYIRFGAWPHNERSRNWLIRDAEVYEKGVSAYHVEYDLDTGLWEIDPSVHENTITGTLESLLMGNRPIFLVQGELLKSEGADGEPLLRNVKIIQQLNKGDVILPGIFERDDILSENVKLDEQRLDEKSRYTIELKKNSQEVSVTVFENPRRSDIERFTNENNGGYFRGFLKPDGNVVVFDAFVATHMDMAGLLGASGAKRFEIRSPNGAKPKTPEMSSMLFIPRSEAGNESWWREQPMIQRMFGKYDFRISLMRY